MTDQNPVCARLDAIQSRITAPVHIAHMFFGILQSAEKAKLNHIPHCDFELAAPLCPYGYVLQSHR